jgi:hypothetical protein
MWSLPHPQPKKGLKEKGAEGSRSLTAFRVPGCRRPEWSEPSSSSHSSDSVFVGYAGAPSYSEDTSSMREGKT